MKYPLLAAVIFAVSLIGHAEKAKVKLEDIDTNQDTAIVIKKGPQANLKECTEYEIVDGKDEINGNPEFDKSKAYASWKTACSEWKTSMKEMNKDNTVMVLNCSRPSINKEGDTYTYHSQGAYKMKVKIKESK